MPKVGKNWLRKSGRCDVENAAKERQFQTKHSAVKAHSLHEICHWEREVACFEVCQTCLCFALSSHETFRSCFAISRVGPASMCYFLWRWGRWGLHRGLFYLCIYAHICFAVISTVHPASLLPRDMLQAWRPASRRLEPCLQPCFACKACFEALVMLKTYLRGSGTLPWRLVAALLCTKHFAAPLRATKGCTKYFPVLLRTIKLAQSISQYYFVLQSWHKVLPSTICSHKALPSTTSYYKARTKCLHKVQFLTIEPHFVRAGCAGPLSHYNKISPR